MVFRLLQQFRVNHVILANALATARVVQPEAQQPLPIQSVEAQHVRVSVDHVGQHHVHRVVLTQVRCLAGVAVVGEGGGGLEQGSEGGGEGGEIVVEVVGGGGEGGEVDVADHADLEGVGGVDELEDVGGGAEEGVDHVGEDGVCVHWGR